VDAHADAIHFLLEEREPFGKVVSLLNQGGFDDISEKLISDVKAYVQGTTGMEADTLLVRELCSLIRVPVPSFLEDHQRKFKKGQAPVSIHVFASNTSYTQLKKTYQCTSVDPSKQDTRMAFLRNSMPRFLAHETMFPNSVKVVNALFRTPLPP
jgi:hypothetical protein